MKIHEPMETADDPRLTAYALGELEAEERETVEELVRADPALAEELTEIRAFASTLERELAPEGDVGLEPWQRDGIVSAEARPARASRRRWRTPLLLAASAAGILFLANLFGVDGDPTIPLRLFSGEPPVDSYHAGVEVQRVPGSEALDSLKGLGYVGDDSHALGLGGAETPAYSHIDLQRLEALGYTDGGTDSFGLSRRPRQGEPGEPIQREGYAPIVENHFLLASETSVSTFSIDVDTASYANVRRFLAQGNLPPADAVRIEELVNYFPYDDPAPTGPEPFATRVEVATCPWQPAHRLVRIGLKGRELEGFPGRPKNLVFLIDVSGSMQDARKLPLLVRSMQLLIEQLTPLDRLSLVVYAGASGLVLPPTSGADQPAMLEALEALRAGGSTNGAGGIELAYRVAEEAFVPGGVNRVILATDGDFNVGVSDEEGLVELIEEQRESGVFLSVLGFGTGNLQDAKMEQLADHGNGNYAYIDSLAEAKKVLVEQAGGTLETIAKDVKIQVAFDPGEVASYRLIGYENRVLANEDFADDTKDAGEIGAGHTVTALYQVEPRRERLAGTFLAVRVRYKEPEGVESRLLEFPVTDPGLAFDEASDDLRFAASVAAFGMLLRDSEFQGEVDLTLISLWARGAVGLDPHGYRREYLRLLERTRALRLQAEEPAWKEGLSEKERRELERKRKDQR